MLKSCRTLFVILIVLFVAGTTNAQHKKARVLFIGNSYTAVNDLPKLIASMAASTGDTLEYDMSAPGGVSFFNHVDPYATSYIHTLTKLKAGGWDYVVMQEQSLGAAAPPENYYQWTFTYAKFLADSVKQYNPCAKIIFYMTWGRKHGLPANCPAYPNWPVYCTYLAMDSVIRQRYIEMAEFNKSAISPVGAVWRHIRNHYPGIELYDADESHPSPAGSYAGACSFYTAIFKKPANLVTYNYSLSAEVAIRIRTAAIRVVHDSLSYWNMGHRETMADFSHTATHILRVSFTNKSVNANRYHWDFGDGQTSTEDNPVHTYSLAKVYSVRLISTGASCSDTAYASVDLARNPNAFIIGPSPASDIVYIKSALFTSSNYRIQVVNNLGQLVYNQQTSGAETQAINVLGLSRGIYTVIICTTRNIYRKKILIQ